MIIKEILKRPISQNKKFRKHSELRKNSLEKKFNNPFNFNIEINNSKNITLDKIVGNNFKVLNINENNKIKKESNLEIFNILESENEGESYINSNYYQTKKNELPEIKNQINNKKLLNLKIVNINEKKLPTLNVNKLFYSTHFNFALKSIKKPIKLTKKLNYKKQNNTFKKNKIASTQNYFINKINLPNINNKLLNRKYNVF